MVAGGDQPLGEQGRELLPRAVVPRRCPPRDRREHGHADRCVGRAWDSNGLTLPADLRDEVPTVALHSC